MISKYLHLYRDVPGLTGTLTGTPQETLPGANRVSLTGSKPGGFYWDYKVPVKVVLYRDVVPGSPGKKPLGGLLFTG